jgi:hypothetical protein
LKYILVSESGIFHKLMTGYEKPAKNFIIRLRRRLR